MNARLDNQAVSALLGSLFAILLIAVPSTAIAGFIDLEITSRAMIGDPEYQPVGGIIPVDDFVFDLSTDSPGTGMGSVETGESRLQLDWTVSSQEMRVDFDQRLVNIADRAVGASFESLSFQPFLVDQRTPFVLDGRFDSDGDPISFFRIGLNMGPLAGPSGSGFATLQIVSAATHPGGIPPIHYALGDDSYGYAEGDLTGILEPGTPYILQFGVLTHGRPVLGDSHTGSGYISLRLVPEPSAAVLLGLGLIGLGASQRKS